MRAQREAFKAKRRQGFVRYTLKLLGLVRGGKVEAKELPGNGGYKLTAVGAPPDTRYWCNYWPASGTWVAPHANRRGHGLRSAVAFVNGEELPEVNPYLLTGDELTRTENARKRGHS